MIIWRDNMGRKPRIQYYGAIYHIIQGNNDEDNRIPIFKNDKDKEQLLRIISETKEIYDFRMFAYVIMDEHYHLLIQTLNIPISKIMHQINSRYAKYYNQTTGNTGSVFKKRYKSVLVQDESYLLNLIRYIHYNPVADNICSTVVEYKWSSDVFYRVNMDNIVDIDMLLDGISSNRIEAIRGYEKFMAEESLEYHILKKKYEEEYVIGKSNLKQSIEESILSLEEILNSVCPTPVEFNLIKGGSRKRYLSKYKREYIDLSRKEGYSYDAIGSYIGITATAARNLESKGD